jgi:RNA polymerase sigma factor (sigma-70 family)
MALWTDLVQDIAGGNRGAEHDLVIGMLPAIRVMIRRRGVHCWADVDDLAQDAIADVLTALRDGRLRDRDKLGAFVARMVANMCTDQHRRQQKFRPLDVDLPSADPLDLPPSNAEHCQNWSRILQAIRALAVARDRDVLVAFYLNGTAKMDICARLNMQPAQFDRVIHRARERVRQLLSEKPAE